MRTRQKKGLCAWLFLALVTGIFLIYHPVCGFYNDSPSAPRGFYLKQLFPGPVSKGQYVIIPVPEVVQAYVYGRGWSQPGTPLLKKVGAMPGDTVSIREEGLYINGEYIGPVLTEDRQGQPLPRLRDTFIIPEGFFFPISSYERSFDGRYFGMVPIKSIQYVVKPVWIINNK